MRIMMGSNVIILEGPEFPSTYAEFGVRAVSLLFLGGVTFPLHLPGKRSCKSPMLSLLSQTHLHSVICQSLLIPEKQL